MSVQVSYKKQSILGIVILVIILSAVEGLLRVDDYYNNPCIFITSNIYPEMGYGKSKQNSVGYHENYFNAIGSNGSKDTRIEDPNEIKKDLEKIGFKEFEYWIRPVGPGDDHSNWIFFTATK